MFRLGHFGLWRFHQICQVRNKLLATWDGTERQSKLSDTVVVFMGSDQVLSIFNGDTVDVWKAKVKKQIQDWMFNYKIFVRVPIKHLEVLAPFGGGGGEGGPGCLKSSGPKNR
jgi:hypothetical protein